ncbi:MAG: hypothetical protein PHP50_01220 [Lachnospiraceae bacterium]|nr:hypothetical protein [Lachnospiraceae bacterium]
MAFQNIWRQQAKLARRQAQTPKERRKQADKDLLKATLWPLGAALLLILYAIYYAQGVIAMDTSTIILAVIMAAFLLVSLPQIKQAAIKRKQIYEETQNK